MIHARVAYPLRLLGPLLMSDTSEKVSGMDYGNP